MKETMQKTLKNFIEYSSINAELIRAVIRQSGGWETFQEIAPDIANYGITSDIVTGKQIGRAHV